MGRYHWLWGFVKRFVVTLFFMGSMDTFGKRLRAARRAMFELVGREPTQGEVGAIVGVKPNAASAWEGDISAPPLDAVPPIAAFLGVTPGWLAFGQEPRYAESPPGAAGAASAAKAVYRKLKEDDSKEGRLAKPARDRLVPRGRDTPGEKKKRA